MSEENQGSEDWSAEVERAIDDHEPGLEPYASMTREQIQGLMRAEGLSAYQHEQLNQHMLDKCTKAELEQINFSERLALWLIEDRNAFGADQCKLLVDVAVEAPRRIFGEMPPPGPLHEIN